ncbi:MAG TPA: bifunctional (p)ppGpp synthetase/guanosine-3',5'-bis(diphosphate) 3'-pyrophosphohydrolase [Polyangiaceae bacterium]|nr:bifunctional (p)ppGpp synthetase/guanosine-3',5'-bis(diphosphate) 3'-pyrophosphohydrolase [Polyangiaceae bacterium]
MTALEGLLQKVKGYHENADLDLIRRAYHYGEWAHREQIRKSGEPYFTHPVRVAGVIAELRLDTASVCAGLLHDVVEDTHASTQDIEGDFGPEIATLVDGVTKLGKINFTSREDRQAESFRKMVVAMAKDIRVLLVKLCDRVDNMRTLEHMKADAQERIARETLEIYAPLANRLGLNLIKTELEDQSFRFLEPEAFAEIQAKLSKSVKERERYIESTARTITSRLAEQGFNVQVSGRAKHPYSIYRKMKSSECAFEQIYDLIAFRLNVESQSDCYACLGAIHSRWTPIPGRFKDYIALPKPNMYQSLHTTVIGPGRQRIEIQIRTHDMHRVAENGVAAHWKYKERVSGGVDPADAQRFGWLRELADYQRNLKDPAEFLESVKIDLFPDEVYVFTPKGDVLVFPRGATPIDFAYAIHSEVGHRCSGARVNGQLVPIRHKLKNGDVVEITTSQNQRPNKDWVDACVTTRAKNRIRAYLRAEKRVKSINLGRELLEAEMRGQGLSMQKLLKNERAVAGLAHTHHVGTLDELLLSIGYGKLGADEVVAGLKAKGDSDRGPAELRPSALETLVRKVKGDPDVGIKVSGIDNVLVRYARCCNPLPGDAIIGFITRGRGVTVHRRECQKAFDTDPERRIEVGWDSRAKVDRPVSIQVVTNNRAGILADISQTLSAQRLNISEANCRASDDGRAVNVFSFRCGDLSHLKNVMRAITKIQGVVSVDRV